MVHCGLEIQCTVLRFLLGSGSPALRVAPGRVRLVDPVHCREFYVGQAAPGRLGIDQLTRV